MTPLQQILEVTLTNVQKLLVDHRINRDVQDPTYDDNPYLESQFNTLYGTTAYDSDKNRNPYKDTLIATGNLIGIDDKALENDLSLNAGEVPLKITLQKAALSDVAIPGKINIFYDNGSTQTHILSFANNALTTPQTWTLPVNSRITRITTAAFSGGTFEIVPTIFYPLTMQETLDLQGLRILDYVQIGFVPIESLEDAEAPSLYIANAMNRHRPDEQPDSTLNQAEEIIPLNFRLMTRQPDAYTLEQLNIITTDKVLEGLKYVLNPTLYMNLSFQRRGYEQPTVIKTIEFKNSFNAEELLSPYEMVDYNFHITLREQNLRE